MSDAQTAIANLRTHKEQLFEKYLGVLNAMTELAQKTTQTDPPAAIPAIDPAFHAERLAQAKLNDVALNTDTAAHLERRYQEELSAHETALAQYHAEQRANRAQLIAFQQEAGELSGQMGRIGAEITRLTQAHLAESAMTELEVLHEQYQQAAEALHGILLKLHMATENATGNPLPTRSIHFPHVVGIPLVCGPFIAVDGFLRIPHDVMSNLLEAERQRQRDALSVSE